MPVQNPAALTEEEEMDKNLQNIIDKSQLLSRMADPLAFLKESMKSFNSECSESFYATTYNIKGDPSDI
jgi:hypothetical protein